MANRDYANRVLFALSFRDLCGYELSKYISTRGERISNGTLNPVLTQLVDRDLISFRADSKKKIYSLTESGLKYVDEIRAIRNELRKRIFVDSIDENALFFDFLGNLDDAKILRELLEYIGDEIMSIVRLGFLLRKSEQMGHLSDLRKGLINLGKEASTWHSQEMQN